METWIRFMPGLELGCPTGLTPRPCAWIVSLFGCDLTPFAGCASFVWGFPPPSPLLLPPLPRSGPLCRPLLGLPSHRAWIRQTELADGFGGGIVRMLSIRLVHIVHANCTGLLRTRTSQKQIITKRFFVSFVSCRVFSCHFILSI